MKKGFTLIELLAVILILGIIALIAIPQITNVIEKSREEANLRSLESHIHNIENNLGINLINHVKLKGIYAFEELGFSKYPENDEIRCASYNINNTHVESASNCLINGKNYCFSESRAISCESLGNLDGLVLKRVNEIRNTPNTDISKRTGNIYYVSSDGSDSNDGLSEATPFKTLNPLHNMSVSRKLADGSTILLRDGDFIRTGILSIYANDILIGSYGDITKGKPTITRSLYDSAKEGTWIEVKPNIWKYQTPNGSFIKADVGVIWLFCNEGNNNCTEKMNTIDKKFMHTQKITTNSSYDETNMDTKIDQILKNDLEFYHVGRSSVTSGGTQGKDIYLYSVGNPSERFDEIEFANGGGIVFQSGVSNGKINNIRILFAGNHAFNAYTMTNFEVSNCEIGFTGGGVQSYNNNGDSIRLGNGIEIYGSVIAKNGFSVDEGFVVKNNYIYQAYDAGATFQLTADGVAKMEKANFSNNVIEYANYDIEFWMGTKSLNDDDSYIRDCTFQDNILRYSGYGVCETRPDIGASALIKTWNHDYGIYNRIIGDFTIKNNKFANAKDVYIYYRSNRGTYPKFVNNTFYAEKDKRLGTIGEKSNVSSILFDRYILNTVLPNNTYIIKNEDNSIFVNDSGKTGSLDWEYNSNTGLLKITGSGQMPHYTLDNPAPWYKYREGIIKIEIGEDVTRLGKYAFYDLRKVLEIRINSKRLSDLGSTFSDSHQRGTWYTFSNVGTKGTGVTVIFGPEVTLIPGNLLNGYFLDSDATLNVTKIKFLGNKIETINYSSLSKTKVDALKLPEGVKQTKSGVFDTNTDLRFLVFPDSFESYSELQAQMLEKVVFGSNIAPIGGAFSYMLAKKITLVIPGVNDPTKINNAFKSVNNPVVVYGDSSTEDWINRIKAEYGKSNITFYPISDYKSTVKSNIGIEAYDIPYNGSYTFTTDKKVEIKMYYQALDNRRYMVDADYTKNGNTYTITKIKSDIYIEAK